MQPATGFESPITGLSAPYTHYLRPDLLQSLSEKLGISIPELQAKLQGSQGLVDIARSRGISVQEIANMAGSVALPMATGTPYVKPAPPGWLPGAGHFIDVRV